MMVILGDGRQLGFRSRACRLVLSYRNRERPTHVATAPRPHQPGIGRQVIQARSHRLPVVTSQKSWSPKLHRHLPGRCSRNPKHDWRACGRTRKSCQTLSFDRPVIDVRSPETVFPHRLRRGGKGQFKPYGAHWRVPAPRSLPRAAAASARRDRRGVEAVAFQHLGAKLGDDVDHCLHIGAGEFPFVGRDFLGRLLMRVGPRELDSPRRGLP